MKLTFFLVTICFHYCLSYDVIDENPGEIEIVSMAEPNYNDLAQMQLVRDSEYGTPPDQVTFDKVKRIKDGGCTKGTGGCSIIIGRFLRSDTNSMQSEPKYRPISNFIHVSKKYKDLKCDENTGACSSTHARLKKPYSYYYTLKKNTDSSPDYVNWNARYFANDHQG